jgi:hypothetical protein
MNLLSRDGVFIRTFMSTSGSTLCVGYMTERQTRSSLSSGSAICRFLNKKSQNRGRYMSMRPGSTICIPVSCGHETRSRWSSANGDKHFIRSLALQLQLESRYSHLLPRQSQIQTLRGPPQIGTSRQCLPYGCNGHHGKYSRITLSH